MLTKRKVENKFADRFRVESSRRLGWNYSKTGIYFITICTLNHNNFFGKINDGKIEYKKVGEIVNEELNKTLEIRKYLKLFAGVVMPNHIHLLLAIRNQQVETPGLASLPGDPGQIPVISNYKKHPDFFKDTNKKSKQIIPATIQQFKASVKRICNQNNLFFAWQSNYYDEIIETKSRYYQIKNYIINNPKNWQKDKFYN